MTTKKEELEHFVSELYLVRAEIRTALERNHGTHECSLGIIHLKRALILLDENIKDYEVKMNKKTKLDRIITILREK